ncbi:bll2871 protein [Vibrio ishigakensis]|uniref:Bll2871 protein n=1 Tax=Vibrio ishigakensis TaxID=1481914 RepID=A0A0B8PLF9_9VIBR|nr:bll2871 protein [Vibrio ishigakensis]
MLDGVDNIDYIGHIAGKQIGVAGNMLATPEVLNAFYNRFVKATTSNADEVIENGEQPSFVEGYEDILPHSLIDALEAALNSGGDKRGTYSASLRIEYPNKAPIDIRVDWSEDQVILDLRKVLSKIEGESFQSFLSGVPSSLKG